MELTVLQNEGSSPDVRACFNMMRLRNASDRLALTALLAILALSPASAFTDWELKHPITGGTLLEWCGSPEDSFKHGMCIGFFWGLTIPCGESQPTPVTDAEIYLSWAARHTNQLTLPAPVVARIALCERK